jgi:hypothetical protein
MSVKARSPDSNPTNLKQLYAQCENKMNKPKREHHVTPRFYLKGFVITLGKPFIWVYKKGEPFNPGNGKVTNNPFKGSIKIAGVERDFYANPALSGADRFESFENDLETLEKPANKTLPKLVAGQLLSPAEKTAFSAYIIHFMRRGSAGRDMTNSMLPSTALLYEPPDELYQKAGLAKTAANRLLFKSAALQVAAKPGYPVQMHQGIVNASTASFLTQALEHMTWHLLKAPAGHAFVTCDNPVFYDKPLGFGGSLSEVTFPISSEYALFASWWKLSNDFVIEVGHNVFDEINRRTINNAIKHVYCSKSLEAIATLFGSANYDYQPISPEKENFKVMELVLTGPRAGYMKQLVELPLPKDTCRHSG